MDRGAARSRKRTQVAGKGAKSADSNPRLAKLLDEDGKPRTYKGRGKPRRDGEGGDRKEGGRPPRKVKEQEDRGPDQYKAKAIRTAHALVYSQTAFAIPPAPERLEGVTRVDLEGSGCTDVSWLPGTVTWLNLKGCAVTEGWEVVAALEGLTVLNISGCGLTALPATLSGLKGLKALVAMNNEWTGLDDAVVGGWKELNSLIVSHSTNLSSLPASLASLPHLAKLAFSHCPRLDAAGLPDLSALPLLRDVKANNLARLATLPAHLPQWGTGDLALAGKTGASTSATKLGDGLEVLDLGNCSLSYAGVSGVFGLAATAHATKKAAKWPHLRSLTLRANPLAVEQPAYAEQLQASTDVPKLQIIDARRVVERARAGEVQESKKDRKARERVAKKARPTGANEHAGAKVMRTWGAGDEAKEDGEGAEEARPQMEAEEARDKKEKSDKPERKEKRRHSEVDEPAKKRKSEDKTEKKRPRDSVPAPAAAPAVEADEPTKKKRKRRHGKAGDEEKEAVAVSTIKNPVVVKAVAKPKARVDAPAPVATHVAVADPAAQRAKKPSRSETAVVGVVDVAPARGGLDLKAVLGGGKKEDGSGAGAGLGVGGW